MVVIRLTNSYCVPVLTYACNIWQLSTTEYRSINVLWNNTFRRIFSCCWRESIAGLQYCSCLPMNYIIEQQTIMFYRRTLRTQNDILRMLLTLKRDHMLSLLEKYIA